MITTLPSSGLRLFNGLSALVSTLVVVNLLWLNLQSEVLAIPDKSLLPLASDLDSPSVSSKLRILPAPEPLDLRVLDQLKQTTCVVIPCSSAASLPLEREVILSTPKVEPSLWWYRDQAKAGLIENWLVYDQSRSQAAPRVDFVLNRGLWSAMDYLERYAFIHTMGAATSRLGYSSRFFNLQQNSQTRLATYTCDFQQQPSACQLVLESIGFNRFR